MSLEEPVVAQGKRLDIQGLRTLAVGLVIIYHLFPGRLTGGFVGVDIFLVISGFLIVGSLVRGVSKTGTISLGTFYARRIRRLLPASTAVLLVVMVVTVLVLPQSRWQSVARDVVASALQIQNWNQAFGSASYESAGALVSPVQHFWSLAVEEQFYLVIPLMLLLAVACGRFLRLSAMKACLGFLILLVVVSFVHSVVFSAASHDLAYFSTTTRMWELGLGGIAALTASALRISRGIQLIAGWAGAGMVILSAVSFQTTMDFPGYVALLPVFGTLFIIVAGTPQSGAVRVHRLAVSQLLSRRPVTYLGDVSYSLYLWHWPVIVFYILIQGHEPGLVGGAGILVLSLALAVLSYHFIEQRFRFGKPVQQSGGRRFQPQIRNRSAYSLASVLLVLSCIAAAGPWSVVQVKSVQPLAEGATTSYPGALAFDPHYPAKVPAGLPIIPDPAVASKDVPLTYKDECGVYDPAKIGDSQCRYGNLSGSKKMVLVGDSHAGQYVDPLAAIASAKGWQVRAMVRNGCPFSAAPPASSTMTYTNCSDQNAVSLKKILDMKPDRVIVSGMTPYGYENALKWGWDSNATILQGYVDMLRPLQEAGIEVSVIADTPYPEFSVPDCVAKNGPLTDECNVVEKQVEDPLLMAAGTVGNVQVIDMNPYLCRGGICPPVVGNVLVFRDNHLTATFAKTLEVPLGHALNLK